MSDASRERAMVNFSFPSILVSNVGKDYDLHKRMLGLEESVMLIMAVLKIEGVDNMKPQKKY